MPARESASAPGKLHIGALSTADAVAVAELAAAATQNDQVAPLSEVPLLHLQSDQPWLTHILVTDNTTPSLVLGYAQVDRSGEYPVAELVVHPAYRTKGIGTQLLRIAEQDARISVAGNTPHHSPPTLRVWAHGNIPEAQAFAARHRYIVVRELLQLTRPLSDDSQGPNPFVSTWRQVDKPGEMRSPAVPPSDAELPTQALPMQSMAAISRARAVRSRAAKPTGPPEYRPPPTRYDPVRGRTLPKHIPSSESADDTQYQLRAFTPGVDDEAWVALNAAIFADHPEQGRLTVSDLQARIAEPWFDPNGFLVLATVDGELAAYCWTKVPTDPGVTAGEIYVIGVSSNHRRKGLAAFLLEAGLSHLANKGLSSVTLYVESDNETALATYRNVGFMPLSSDAQYSKFRDKRVTR